MIGVFRSSSFGGFGGIAACMPIEIGLATSVVVISGC